MNKETSFLNQQGAGGCLLAPVGILVGLVWVNSPISLYCLGAGVAAAGLFILVESVRPKSKLGAAILENMARIALCACIAFLLCWLAQIGLNIWRDRTDPNAVLDSELWFYDLSAMLKTLTGPLMIVAAFAFAFLVSIVLDRWEPLARLVVIKRLSAWLAAFVGALSLVSFVSVGEADHRRSWVVGTIRAQIGADLGKLEEARKRRVAAQWLAAEVAKSPEPIGRYAKAVRNICSAANDDYRNKYQDAFRRAGAQFAFGSSDLCELRTYAPRAANLLVTTTSRPAAADAAWMPEYSGLLEPVDNSTKSPPATVTDDMMEADDGTEGPAAPLNLNTSSASWTIRAARQVRALVAKDLEREQAAAESVKAIATNWIAAAAGETDESVAGMLVDGWVDALAEHLAGETIDAIRKRIALTNRDVATPRDAVLALARLPVDLMPVSFALAKLPDRDLLRKLFQLITPLADGQKAGDAIAERADAAGAVDAAKETGKTVRITGPDGREIVAEPPPPPPPEPYHPPAPHPVEVP